MSALSRTPARAQLELEVHDVLEGRPLTGARTVTCPDQEPLAFALAHAFDRHGQGARGVRGVGLGADRKGVAVGTQPRRGAEIELRAGGVDKVIVVLATGVARVTAGGLVSHVRPRVADIPLRVDRRRAPLPEADARALIDRRQREHHVRGLHQPDADPDVRGDPVVGRAG